MPMPSCIFRSFASQLSRLRLCPQCILAALRSKESKFPWHKDCHHVRCTAMCLGASSKSFATSILQVACWQHCSQAQLNRQQLRSLVVSLLVLVASCGLDVELVFSKYFGCHCHGGTFTILQIPPKIALVERKGDQC